MEKVIKFQPIVDGKIISVETTEPFDGFVVLPAQDGQTNSTLSIDGKLAIVIGFSEKRNGRGVYGASGVRTAYYRWITTELLAEKKADYEAVKANHNSTDDLLRLTARFAREVYEATKDADLDFAIDPAKILAKNYGQLE